MIQSTPHPPEIPVTKATPFGMHIGDQNLFSVQPGIKVEDALVLATEYLACRRHRL